MTECLHLHQELIAEDPHNVSVPQSAKRTRSDYGPGSRRKFMAKLNGVNGVVLSSKLKPGQPPIETPFGYTKDYARLRMSGRNKCCPVCGDWFQGASKLQPHFVNCVGRNGHPHGHYWDGALSDERRIGRKIAELYYERDENTGTSTDDESSGVDAHTISYKPSESDSQSGASNPDSLASTPSLHPDRNDYTGAYPQTRTRAVHGYGEGATEISDEEVSDSPVDSPHFGKVRRAGILSKAVQGPPPEQLRGSQVQRYAMRYEKIKRARVLIRAGTAGQLDIKANTTGADGHGSIHGDFDTMHIVPETALPTRATPLRHTINNAQSFPTPVTPGEFAAGRLSVPSPGDAMLSLTSPAGDTKQRFCPPPKPFPSSPPSSAKKRQISSEPSPLSESSKRQRMLPAEMANLRHAKTAAGPSRQSEKQGPQVSPASAEEATLILSRMGWTSGESMDKDSVRVHQSTGQSRGAGLIINTKLAASAVRPPVKIEPTSGEKLVSDYIKTHKEFRKELDNLSHELEVANKRAERTELQVQEAQDMVYRANNDAFAKLKTQEDIHKKEKQRQQLEYKSLRTRYDTLEQSICEKSREIDELKWELEQRRHLRW